MIPPAQVLNTNTEKCPHKLEGWVFIRTHEPSAGNIINAKSDRSILIRHYLVLEGTDLYFYDNEAKMSLKFMYSIAGCFARKCDKTLSFEGLDYESIQVILSEQFGKTLFFSKFSGSADLWLQSIRASC